MPKGLSEPTARNGLDMRWKVGNKHVVQGVGLWGVRMGRDCILSRTACSFLCSWSRLRRASKVYLLRNCMWGDTFTAMSGDVFMI